MLLNICNRRWLMIFILRGVSQKSSSEIVRIRLLSQPRASSGFPLLLVPVQRCDLDGFPRELTQFPVCFEWQPWTNAKAVFLSCFNPARLDKQTQQGDCHWRQGQGSDRTIAGSECFTTVYCLAHWLSSGRLYSDRCSKRLKESNHESEAF